MSNNQSELRISNYNYNADVFLSRVRHLLERDERLLGPIRQRSIVVKSVGREPEHAVTRLDVLPFSAPVSSSETVDYGTLSYFSEVLSKERLMDRLSSLAENKFEVAGQHFSAPSLGFQDRYDAASQTNWPTRIFDVSFGSVQIPYEPLLHPTLKSFSTPLDAIRDFLGFGNFAGSSDSRLGHILLYVPNLNARLTRLQLTEKHLLIRVNGSANLDSLKLDIAYKNAEQTATTTHALHSPDAAFELAFVPTELTLWLISRQGFICDFHEENEHHSIGAAAVLPKKREPLLFDTVLHEAYPKFARGDGGPTKVFIIHGHHTAHRESLARFIEKLDLEAVILHEQPNLGNTIIEKFETNSQVGFAVALLTGDDEARKLGDVMPFKPRARQNVIFEFGYFIGKLGRSHVCALLEKDVEVPSDYSGVVYIPLDDTGNWKFALVRELKAAGFVIDANRALE